MKTILTRCVLTILATLPVATVAYAAQNGLQAIDDQSLGRRFESEKASTEADALVRSLHAKGLVSFETKDMRPPGPSWGA